MRTAKAAEAYPELVQNGRFIGVLSTNSMEGGNWRMKFALKVPYKDVVSAEARTVLVAIADSAKTFSQGRPCESFAHRHGCEYSDVMTMNEHADTDKDKDTDMDREISPHRGGDNDSSDDPIIRHTEEFILWLNNAVERAGQNRKKF